MSGFVSTRRTLAHVVVETGERPTFSWGRVGGTFYQGAVISMENRVHRSL